jgi:polyisoprenoid-binding protein YceI
MPSGESLFVAAALVLATPAPAAGPYRIDPARSFLVAVTGVFGGRDNVRVRFPVREGRVDYEPQASGRTRIALSVDARSAQGTAAVVSAASAALQPDRFPVISFRSRELDLRGGSAQGLGDLTLHGVTQPVGFTISSEQSADGSGLRLRGHARIRRSDFGLPGSAPLARDTVELCFDVTLRPG